MNVLLTPHRVAVAVVFAPLLSLLSACSPKAEEYQPAEAAEVSQYKVTGKVTYKGKPVPYGYVIFYGQSGIDKATGKSAPPIVAKIDADGRYEIHNAALGPTMICVATDPDADIGSFYQPASFVPGMGGPPPMDGPPPDGPPGIGGPAGGPPMPGGPPGV
ncbi:MAG: hypothetical protein L0241_21545, partial [Planctomycetia bacterium]|nr:hypothetical protein [Planctomycetia bacterium]